MDAARSCASCGSHDLIEDDETGEVICAGCGLVVSTGDLKRPRYLEEMQPDRVRRSSSSDPKMERLMTIDRRIRLDEGDPHGIRTASSEIKRLIDTMHLPDSVEVSAEGVYRHAQREALVLRGSIIGFAAASVYAACRMRGIPRTLREVGEASSEDVKNIARMYRILVSELGFSVERDSPLNHLARITEDVGLSPRAERLATDILMAAIKAGYHTGKSPEGLAASALYIACKELDEGCTQDILSDVSGVSTLTIRKRARGLSEAVKIRELVESLS